MSGVLFCNSLFFLTFHFSLRAKMFGFLLNCFVLSFQPWQTMTTYAYSPRPQSHVGYSPFSGMGYQEGYAPGNIAGGQHSMAFRKRMERIDWRKIASVDVDQIARMMDFNALQENITNITFCNIEAELVSPRGSLLWGVCFGNLLIWKRNRHKIFQKLMRCLFFF